MQRRWMRRLGSTVMGAIVSWMSVGQMGCAAERDPINRIQPAAIPKSFFLGADFVDPSDNPEFYARSMVIDVPYGVTQALAATNTLNKVTRIKWEITGNQGDTLVGRVAYERLPGTDGKGVGTGEKSLEGQVAYAFRVLGHFDIRRSYNPQTGEEANVIEENSTDRPWQDREYVRVDWSKNLMNAAYDFDTLAFLGFIGGYSYESLGLHVSDPNSDDAPSYDIANGYLDVTDKVFASPKMIELPESWGGGSYPACLIGSILKGGEAPNGSCSAELTVRHSFMRVVDKDYEPLDWDGFKFQAFGAFTSERMGYSREYGLTDDQWFRFVERYNIWNRSHWYQDAEAMSGPKSCEADTDCEGVGRVGGSHCDRFNHKCTLPYREREAKPIVWYYADKSDQDYFDASKLATYDWDTAMRLAVASARYAECQRFQDGGDCGEAPVNGQIADEEDAVFLVREVEACREKFNRAPDEAAKKKTCDAVADDLAARRGYSSSVAWLAKQPTMVHLCHSPVAASDPAECGDVGTKARLGDLRRNLVTSIEAPQSASPWGIMSDANDPLTGEKVATSVNVWTSLNDRFAQGLVDTLRYIAGELDTKDLTEATYIYDWAEAARRIANQQSVSPGRSQDDVMKAVGGMLDIDAQQIAAFKKPMSGELKAAMDNVVTKMHDLAYAVEAPSSTYPVYAQRLKSAQNSDLEADLATPAMQQLGASGPFANPGDPIASASMFRGINPSVRRQMHNALELGYAKRGVCVMEGDFMATAPLGYVAFGEVLQQKFGKFGAHCEANDRACKDEQVGRASKMKDYIRRRAHYAVVAHEMGHSFGLRHNFVSSSDSFNFRPQYWQLRTNDKAVTKACTGPVTDGRTCVGSRRFDPVTTNESNNLIHMFAQSSTMEYPGEPTQDMLALGAYDFGAAMAFYGDVASVYVGDGPNAARLKKVAVAHQSEFGGLLGIQYSGISHYSQLDRQLDLIRDCQPVDVEAFKPTTWDDARDGAWSPLLDGLIVTNEQGQATRCKQQPVDYVQFAQLNQPDATSGRSNKAYSVDESGRVRVPFGFASDDWADTGNVSVYRHDNGADIYELMQFWISQQEANHVFSSYRRGRTSFGPYSVFEGNLGRYHEKMRDAGKALGFFFSLARDTAAYYSPQDGDALVANLIVKDFPEQMLASSIAFDHFAHMFARPQAGDHGALQGGDSVLRSFDGTGFVSFTNKSLVIPNGVSGTFGQISLGGRPLENKLADNKGNYDRDYVLNCGSYYEKAFTAMLFTESSDNFISSSRDDFNDPRFRSVSLADIFPDGFRRWLANNLTGDDAIKGPRVQASNGKPVVDEQGLPRAGVGWTSWWPKDGIEACFPGAESIYCRTPNDAEPVNDSFPTVAVDPQVGWEQQKFALVNTLTYLPENQKTYWLNQIHLWTPGDDPGFENRIEFHGPSGEVYIAQTLGTEVLYGKTVQRGIGARVLEWANELLEKAYDVTPVTQNGVTWYVPNLAPNGQPVVKLASGTPSPTATCAQNPSCVKLQDYSSMMPFIRKAYRGLGYSTNMKGIY